MDAPRKTGKSEKMKEIDDRLAQARRKTGSLRPNGRQGSAFGVAFKIATDFIAAVGVGVGIGWMLDSWLSSKPWFLLLFFMLGVAAGLLNVIRTAKRLNENNQ